MGAGGREVIQQALAASADRDQLVAGIDALLHTPLPMLDDEGKVSKSWRARAERRLCSRHIGKHLAKAIVRWTIFAGGHASKIPGCVTLQQLQMRTAYDLFISAMRVARSHYPNYREPAERAAFEMLLGKYNHR